MSGYRYTSVHTVFAVVHALAAIACLVLAIVNSDKYRQELQGHVANARFLREHYNMAVVACMLCLLGMGREALLAAGLRPFSDPTPPSEDKKGRGAMNAVVEHFEHIGTRSSIAHVFTILWQVTSFWLLAQVSFVTEIGALIILIGTVLVIEQLLFTSKAHVARKTALSYTNMTVAAVAYILAWVVIFWHADRAFEHQATQHADEVLIPFLAVSAVLHMTLYILRFAQVFGATADADNPETEKKCTGVQGYTIVLGADTMFIAFTVIFRLSYSADKFVL